MNSFFNRSLYLVQDPKTLKKDRQKVEDKWKILTKQATIKNPNFKEPIGIFIHFFNTYYVNSSVYGKSYCWSA